jgi:hypothetical protein
MRGCEFVEIEGNRKEYALEPVSKVETVIVTGDKAAI